jgi:hypothetical protein
MRIGCRSAGLEPVKVEPRCREQNVEVMMPDVISNHQGFCDRIAEEVGQGRLAHEATKMTSCDGRATFSGGYVPDWIYVVHDDSSETPD